MYPFGEPITECSVLNISILVRVTIPQDFLIDLIDKFFFLTSYWLKGLKLSKKKKKKKKTGGGGRCWLFVDILSLYNRGRHFTILQVMTLLK